MAVTDHYDFWYLDPDEEISDFPSTWNYNIDDIDAAIYGAATNNVALSRLPNLPAGKVTSGTFADARIPDSIARTSDVPDLEVNNESGTRISIGGHVIYYDSGWRDISGDIQNDWGGQIQVRRTLDSLNVAVVDLVPPESAYNNRFCPLPSGFYPYIPDGPWITVPVRRTTNTVAFATLSKTYLYFNRADEFQDGFWNMMTVPAADTLPTSLPGTPA